VAALDAHRLDPGQAALTHQGYRWWQGAMANAALAPACDRCIAKDTCDQFTPGGTCAPAEEEQAALVAEVMALDHVRPQDHRLVREWAKVAVALDIVDAYIGRTSPFLPGADAGFLECQPVLQWRAQLSAALSRLAGELGLSPAARSRLATSKDRPLHPLERVILEADRQDQLERAGAVDAEWEDEPDDQDADTDPDEGDGDADQTPPQGDTGDGGGEDPQGGTEDAPGGAGPTEGEDTEGGADQ